MLLLQTRGRFLLLPLRPPETTCASVAREFINLRIGRSDCGCVFVRHFGRQICRSSAALASGHTHLLIARAKSAINLRQVTLRRARARKHALCVAQRFICNKAHVARVVC